MVWTRTVFMLTLVGFVAAVSTSEAGVPCPETSTLVAEVEGDRTCQNADIVWSLSSSRPMDLLFLRVTVRDCDSVPVEECDLQVEIQGWGDPQDEIEPAKMSVCGNPSRFATTDADGAAEILVIGGGAGRIVLAWTVTANCGGPIDLGTNSDTLCVKSHDLTGDLKINFFDVFKYLPQLSIGLGWSGDYICDGNINFFDTSIGEFLIAVVNANECDGFELQPAFLGDCP